ncbi:MAG: cobalt transporter CbiM [Euryarchaeota archaeon]|uniref:Cobalamin biosynthesis protein CbiM n=1 Tax=Candidatus Methanogaster sp. TaxID=3386292 RepID=A0AC61KZT3_9EURY|nr:cobalt transporter CbiM [Euryarchaeota archaeon]PXF58446.1 MAG: cobalamin biosynthesis protein CbiM [ANME-2 cluster archaeon]
MVHISDGVPLDPLLIMGSWVVTVAILLYALSKMKTEDVPKLSVITAAVFVASLIHIQFGPTSVHFVLNGFAGVMLGILAFPCIFVALVLQCFLFSFGGVTMIGINTINMGVPALIAYLIFKTGTGLDIRPETRKRASLFAAIAGGLGVVLALLFLATELITIGDVFLETTIAVVTAHLPIIAIEAIFTGVLAGFIAAVKPEMFEKK